MSTLIDTDAQILRLGVSGETVGNYFIYDIGGAGVVTNEQPFDIEAPFLGVLNLQPFNIGTMTRATNDQPFDLGEVTGVTNYQPFDIISNIANPDPGTPQDPVVVSGSTTLYSAAAVGVFIVTVVDGTELSVSSTIYIGGHPYVVSAITPVSGDISEITLSSPTVTAYAVGTTVFEPLANTTSVGSTSSGATTITVTDPSAFYIGQSIGIGTSGGTLQYRQITGISGSVLTLSAPLGAGVGGGTAIVPAPPFLTGIGVYDKAGSFLGQIVDYSFNEPRSYQIGDSGSMSFYIPRNSPDVGLIASDRIVAVTNQVGLPLWAGTITTQEWSGSTGNVHCEDLFSLLAGVAIEMDIEVMDGTLASAVYQQVIDLVNMRRGLDGEIQWGTDYAGSVTTFLGDFKFSGDPDEALRQIADRTGTEYAWQADLAGNSLSITLVVRDAFAGAAGVALTDGPGGNVVASPSYQIDPTTIVNGVRVTGDTTEITRYVADWAEWAVFEIEPVVEIYTATGDFRRRIDLDVQVDFSLSKTQQRALGLQTQDDVWALYERYLYAVHDIYGRPNHEGWLYEGPTEELEPELTKDVWRTHLELAVYRDGRPVSIVMKSDDAYIIVIWNQTYSRKDVRKHEVGSVYALPRVDATASAGTYTIYEESGGAADVFTMYTTSGETFICMASSIIAKLPNGSRKTLRQIAEGTFRGRYLDLSEPTFVVTPHPSALNVTTEGNQIGYIWPIEKPRIRDWDPRRDGTGALISKETVFSGQLTTRPRWHIVPYSTGEEVETRLIQGVNVVNLDDFGYPIASDTLFVESAFGFPVDNLPFYIVVGDPLARQEVMQVTAVFGNKWTVLRGATTTQAFTTADVSAGATVIPVTDTAMFLSSMVIIIGNETVTIEEVGASDITLTNGVGFAHPSGSVITNGSLIFTHEAGESVRLLGGTQFDGFKYPYSWPEGELYAANLLARLSQPSRLINLRVTNENDDWASFSFGSTHSVNIQSEGPPGGVVATVRCIGMSPDEDAGEMEVVLEIIG